MRVALTCGSAATMRAVRVFVRRVCVFVAELTKVWPWHSLCWVSFQVECRNYIRTLHKVNDTTMYVCGTNAFSPTCDYMVSMAGGALYVCILDPILDLFYTVAAQSGAFVPHFSPLTGFPCLCSCQTFANGQLRLAGRQEKGQGKCPFDPFQRYSSLMVGECLHQVSSPKAKKKNCKKYLFQRRVQI